MHENRYWDNGILLRRIPVDMHVASNMGNLSLAITAAAFPNGVGVWLNGWAQTPVQIVRRWCQLKPCRVTVASMPTTSYANVM